MSNTRDFKSLGVQASDAVEVTEDGFRDKGTAYRRTNLTGLQQTEGELYDEPPSTANINQKLYNSSSFTDAIDTTGILRWSNLVDYEPPAFVWNNDGTINTGDFYVCLRASGPSTSPVDPLSDNQDNPVFWRILENPEQLRLDLADETPGNEGSKLVGYNNFNTNGGVDDGLTVKAALDVLSSRVNPLVGINILASLDVKIITQLGNPPSLVLENTLTSFNIDLTMYDSISSIGAPGLFQFVQGIKVVYINPLPSNYIVLNNPWTQGVFDTSSGNTNVNNARSTISYLNKSTTDMEVYGADVNGSPEGGSPPGPTFRFNFICYEIVP